MQKIVNEKGELVLKRHKWMQQVMNATYNDMIVVAILAPKGKGLDGAWEYAIQEYLKRLWKSNRNDNRYLVQILLDETGKEGLNAQFEKAAEMIMNSQPEKVI